MENVSRLFSESSAANIKIRNKIKLGCQISYFFFRKLVRKYVIISLAYFITRSSSINSPMIIITILSSRYFDFVK